MRASAIVALVVLASAAPEAQTDRWRISAAAATLVEAWDHNESRESLAGVMAGLDGRVWKGVSLRTEGIILHVSQQGHDGLMRGFIVGARNRWHARRLNPFVELAVGLSDSTRPVPARGTSFNFLIAAGAGVEKPLGPLYLELGGRWLHVSNNGREGRSRNPDIQALGLVIGIGWTY